MEVVGRLLNFVEVGTLVGLCLMGKWFGLGVGVVGGSRVVVGRNVVEAFVSAFVAVVRGRLGLVGRV